MHGCRGNYITVRGPALRSVLVAAPLFGSMNLLSQQLARLALHHCSKLGDGGIRAMVLRLQSLTALDLSGSAVLTDESLRHVRCSLPHTVQAVSGPAMRWSMLRACIGWLDGGCATAAAGGAR